MGVAKRLFDHLLDQQDRESLAAKLRRQIQDAINHDWRQPARWLVQHEQARVTYDSLRDRQDLLLTAAETRRQLATPFRERDRFKTGPGPDDGGSKPGR